MTEIKIIFQNVFQCSILFSQALHILQSLINGQHKENFLNYKHQIKLDELN